MYHCTLARIRTHVQSTQDLGRAHTLALPLSLSPSLLLPPFPPSLSAYAQAPGRHSTSGAGEQDFKIKGLSNGCARRYQHLVVAYALDSAHKPLSAHTLPHADGARLARQRPTGHWATCIRTRRTRVGTHWTGMTLPPGTVATTRNTTSSPPTPPASLVAESDSPSRPASKTRETAPATAAAALVFGPPTAPATLAAPCAKERESTGPDDILAPISATAMPAASLQAHAM